MPMDPELMMDMEGILNKMKIGLKAPAHMQDKRTNKT
jgi:hypothetical protein